MPRRVARSTAVTTCTVAVLFWGIGPLLVHAMSVDIWAIVVWRLWLGVPVMMLIARRESGPISVRRLSATWPAGLLFVGSLSAGFAAFRTTSIANATLIQSLSPLVILVVAPRLFGERVSARTIAIAGTAMAGIAMVVFGAGRSGAASLRGDLLAGVSLVAFSGYFVLAKQARDRGVPTGTFLAGVFLVSAVAMTPFAVAFSTDLSAPPAKDLVLLGCMVLGPGALGHGLMTWSQKHLPITVASLLTLASPVVSTVGAWLIEHQALRPVQIAGIVVVIAALVILVIRRRSTNPVPAGSVAASGPHAPAGT